MRLLRQYLVEMLYCDTYIGQESRMPIVRLMPKGANRVCPLLEGNRCAVHLVNPSLKPIVCSLAPIGRVVASEHAPKNIGLGEANEITYILTNFPCASMKRKQTVRAWLERFGVPIDDEFFIKWNAAVFKIFATVQKYEGKDGVTDKALEMLWGVIFTVLYIDYSISTKYCRNSRNA